MVGESLASVERSASRGVRSQTLERALDALQVLADGKRRTSQELADELGLHRSVVYRILRTLEDYTLVARAPDGRYLLGLGIAALAEAGMGELEAQVAVVLQELANMTSATALFCGPQRDDAVVLSSARPSQTPTSIAIRTGTRFPLDKGAPGLAVLSLREPVEYEPDEVTLARQTGLVHTKGTPFAGLEALAVPIRLPDGQGASLSVIFPMRELDVIAVERSLRAYAIRLVRPGDNWEV